MEKRATNVPNTPLDEEWALGEAWKYEREGDHETAEHIHAIVEMERAEAARRRADAMDTSWVRPILSGFEGESVLDD